MSLCIFGDGFPAAGVGAYAGRCWRHVPEAQDRYPVLVTYTDVHVVWVEADSPDDAVESIRDEPYEYTSSATSVDGWSDVKAPDKWDSHLLGLYCDAHVQAYRSHQWELARAAEAVLAS